MYPRGMMEPVLSGSSDYLQSSQQNFIRRQTTDLFAKRQWLIFYYASMKETAYKVRDLMDGAGVLSELEWKRFNDGFPNLAINKSDAQRIESFYGTCFIVSFHTPEVIFEQLALLYALPKLRARNFRIILPWFSTGTMERVEQVGQIATANSLARMLSSCPMGPGGPGTVVIFDIHALQEQFYFSDALLVELKTAMHLLNHKISALKANDPGEEFAIVFPDEGASKRFGSKFPGFKRIVCAKVRQNDELIVSLKEGSPAGRHVIIVDDLVQSGGTLLECAAVCKEKGALKISCFVTHAIFPRESWKHFVGNDLIHKFWITDSIPSTCAQINGKEPFEVLSLAPLICNYLIGIAED